MILCLILGSKQQVHEFGNTSMSSVQTESPEAQKISHISQDLQITNPYYPGKEHHHAAYMSREGRLYYTIGRSKKQLRLQV